ncbi:MAG: phosphoribosyltransferase [Candidatus Bathyarchaeota archaeon]|nr:phosphoribosyltransferase [Candidatus Bathyarchaeota archaeon]
MAYFLNRIDAGKRLASKLKEFVGKNAIALAIPRGGVVVGYEIAAELNLPLDVIIPHKLGAPDNPELAIGAITEDGTTILDDNLVTYLGVSREYIREESERQKQEIRRRLKAYRQDAPYPNLSGLDVILVDDGIATGSTMKAALLSVRNKGAASVIVAVPVGPPSTIRELKKQADRVICPYTPEYFQAIGQFYDDFSQVSDEEVIQLLKQSRQNVTQKPQGMVVS